jgi:hypothetical protein
MNLETQNLDAKVALELSALLESASVDSPSTAEPSADLLYLMELYIPQLLARNYPEWKGESLDGFLFAKVQKVESWSVEFIGLCILMSDQTVTPIFIELNLTKSRDVVASYRVFLGEAGGGRLGISGPPCNSQRVHKLLENLCGRLDGIRWVYTVAKDTAQQQH